MFLRREILLLFDAVAFSLQREELADIAFGLQRRIALSHGLVNGDRPLQLVQHRQCRPQVLRRARDGSAFLRERIQIGRAVGPILGLRAREHFRHVPRLPQQRPVREFGVDAPQLQRALRQFTLQRPRLRFLHAGVEPKQHLAGQYHLALGHRNFDDRSGIRWLDDLETCARCKLALGNRDDIQAPEHQPQRRQH